MWLDMSRDQIDSVEAEIFCNQSYNMFDKSELF